MLSKGKVWEQKRNSKFIIDVQIKKNYTIIQEEKRKRFYRNTRCSVTASNYNLLGVKF